MKSIIKFFITGVGCFFSTMVVAQQSWTSALVKVNTDKSLQYIADEKGNVLPDFSAVGCYEGGKLLPEIAVVKTIEPSGDNSQQSLQAALDKIANLPLDKNGFRGALLLRKGVYKIPGTIKITASGIVLRGEGEQTILVATGKGQRSLISVSGSGSLKEENGTRQNIADKFVPLGAKSFMIQNGTKFKVGDSIAVFRPGTQQWIDDLKMNQIEVRDSNTRQWTPADYDLHFERVITKITGNRIFIDQPIVMAMEEKYGGGEVYKCSFAGRIHNIGIENILCKSEYNGDTDEDHGWDAVHFNKIENSWIKNVTAVYFGYSCVNLGDQSRNITVLDSKYLDAKSKIEGGRRYSFNNDGQMNLFINCFASDGRHDYVTGAKVRGPNVFYHCKAVKTHADIGPHHRWAMGTLYDNIVSDGEINAQDRGDWGTGHGWSGVNQVFWNCTASQCAIQDPWVSGKNYVIGMKAVPYAGRLKGRTATVWEMNQDAVLVPVSLYEAQLKERRRKL